MTCLPLIFTLERGKKIRNFGLKLFSFFLVKRKLSLKLFVSLFVSFLFNANLATNLRICEFLTSFFFFSNDEQSRNQVCWVCCPLQFGRQSQSRYSCSVVWISKKHNIFNGLTYCVQNIHVHSLDTWFKLLVQILTCSSLCICFIFLCFASKMLKIQSLMHHNMHSSVTMWVRKLSWGD